MKFNLTYKTSRRVGRFCLILGFGLCSTLVEAQEYSVDSLRNLLEADREDTVKIVHLTALCDALSSSEADESLIYIEQALAIARKMNATKFIGDCVYRKGRYYRVKGDYSMALDQYLQALKLFESISYKVGISSCLNSVGAVHYHLNNYSEAIHYFMEATNMAREDRDQELLAACYSNIGSAYVFLAIYDSALVYHRLSLKTEEQLGNLEGMAESWINIGNVYFEEKQIDQALHFYTLAQQQYEKIGNSDLNAVLLINIGSIYSQKKQFSSARKYYLESIPLAQSIQAKDILKDGYFNLAVDYASEKKWEHAYSNFRIYAKIKDSIFNEQSSRQIAEMQTKYETDKKEKENQLLKQEKEIRILHDKQEKERLRIKAEAENRRNSLQYSIILIGLVSLSGVLLVIGRFEISHNLAEGLIFFAFLIFFEFLLVLGDPYIENWTGGAPGWKLLINATVAAAIFPLHAFFENKLKKQLLKHKQQKT